ncbi:MAG: hypothetical protein ACRDK7_15900 [Solirubrobacteraceae bacterium]
MISHTLVTGGSVRSAALFGVLLAGVFVALGAGAGVAAALGVFAALGAGGGLVVALGVFVAVDLAPHWLAVPAAALAPAGVTDGGCTVAVPGAVLVACAPPPLVSAAIAGSSGMRWPASVESAPPTPGPLAAPRARWAQASPRRARR